MNNRTRYIALCEFLKTEYSITVKDVIPEESKPFSKIYNKNKKELLLSDYNSLETKKLHAAAQIAQEGAIDIINDYLSEFKFPSEESKSLTQIALLNYCGAAILMPYKLFHSECKKLKYDLELLQNTFATSFEQVAHRVTCLQDPKLPGLGCEAKYAKEFVYTENLSLNDKKTEIPIGVSCRTCDRLDCSQRAFPPLHKKFDVDINARGVSVYVSDK